MDYQYPIVITGYLWNLMQKIWLALNLPEESVSISISSTHTTIHTPRELSIEEKSILDNIVTASNPCAVPTNTNKTTYRLVDIWSMRQWFYDQIGLIPTFWFMNGNPDGSGECYIYIEFNTALTNSEKRTVETTYAKMIGEVVI